MYIRYRLRLLLFLLIVSTNVQSQINLTINKKVFEAHFEKKDNTHGAFTILKNSDKTAPLDSIKSIPLLAGTDEATFNTVFDALLAKAEPDFTTWLNDKEIIPDIIAARKKSYDNFGKINPPAKTVNPEIQVLNERLDELTKEIPTMKSVGVFKLTKNTVEVKSKSPVKGDVGAADIEEVSITLAHGAIAKRGLIVTLKDGRIFLNRDAPISLASFFRRTTDLIRINDKDQTTYIKLGDLMTYVPIGKFYYPADGEFKIRADKKLVDTLRIGSTFNEYINASVYTDLLGLLGRKPNGILQTEISGNFISNAANLWSNADIVFHNFIQPYFRLSKFDSRFTQLDSSNIKSSPSKKDSVNRAYLNQIAYLIAGLKTNIVRFGIGVNQQVYLNFGIEVGLANADSIYNKDITFINWYPEITYSINKLDNFGIECSLRLLKQHIAHGSPFANNDGQTIINSQASLFYYPFSNSNNRMYLRFNYYDNVKGFAYNFSQFQLGWKTSLLTNKSSK